MMQKLKILLACGIVLALLFTPLPSSADSKEPTYQVRVELKTIEWTTDNSFDYGFTILYTRDNDSGAIIRTGDLTLPSQAAMDIGMKAFLDGISINQGDFTVILEALKQVGEVKVISEPTIICKVETFEGDRKKEPYSSMVKTGSRVPYEAAQPVGSTLAEVTRFRDVGVTLRVGAEQIINDEYIRLNIYNSVTNLAGYISVGRNREGNPMVVPEIYTRNITNTVITRNKSVLITGVLKDTSNVLNERGVPYLSSIPILGYLFKNRITQRKSHELLFLLRAEILREPIECIDTPQ